MQRWLTLPVLFVAASVVSTLAADCSWATEEFMQRLPVSSRFQCLICHQDPTPTIDQAPLNVFGEAFRDHGNVWDAELAAQSADNDHCTNGFELADENGDGVLDAGTTEERKNPGADDCDLQLNKTAWSALKKLFQ